MSTYAPEVFRRPSLPTWAKTAGRMVCALFEEHPIGTAEAAHAPSSTWSPEIAALAKKRQALGALMLETIQPLVPADHKSTVIRDRTIRTEPVFDEQTDSNVYLICPAPGNVVLNQDFLTTSRLGRQKIERTQHPFRVVGDDDVLLYGFEQEYNHQGFTLSEQEGFIDTATRQVQLIADAQRSVAS